MDTTTQDRAKEYIDSYIEHFEPRMPRIWNYEEGCVLRGAQLIYQITNDDKYLQFIKDFLKVYILDDGTINYYRLEEYNIDKINPGKVLLFMYEETREEKYRIAFETLVKQLEGQPRCNCGNFFHKAIYPYQVWLDGVYMALPFLMEYDTKYGKLQHYQDIRNQFDNVEKYLYNPETKLHYHGYDETKSIFWCNKETGCSQNYWLRSIGWHLMALVDVMSAMNKEMYADYRAYVDIFRKTLDGVLFYQDQKSKLFYQVVDHRENPKNYLETSGSVMIAYAIIKACNMRIIDSEKYYKIGCEIFENIVTQKVKNEGDRIVLSDNCKVAGLGPIDDLRRDGTVAYYLSEPIINDDKKSVGTFFMTYSEIEKYEKNWRFK